MIIIYKVIGTLTSSLTCRLKKITPFLYGADVNKPSDTKPLIAVYFKPLPVKCKAEFLKNKICRRHQSKLSKAYDGRPPPSKWWRLKNAFHSFPEMY